MPRQLERECPCSKCRSKSMARAATVLMVRCGCGQLDVVSAELWGVRDNQGRIQYQFSDPKKFGVEYDVDGMTRDPEVQDATKRLGLAADTLGSAMERFLK
jgi:hypothetical protein